MKAILYAAGRGMRLGREFEERPKILLEFGGRSLLAWHALRLSRQGVREIVIVTGHLREQIVAALPALSAEHGIAFREVVNPAFREGSVLSMAASLPEIEQATEAVLLMDGDVLYPDAMLARLVASPHPTALLIDREFSTADDDPVLVPVRGGRPVDLMKHWKGDADLVGESIGFFKLDPEDVPRLAASTRDHSARRETPFEEVFRDLVRAKRFGHEDVTGLPWTEIDFPEDVARAADAVYPAIAALGLP